MSTTRTTTRITLVSLGIAVSGALMTGYSQMPEGMPAADISAEQRALDSIAARKDSIDTAVTAQLNKEAADAYKHLKFIQYDGVTEQELYPEAMSTYRKTLDALAAPKRTDQDMTRLRGVLIDILPTLMRGSIFYSQNQNAEEFTRFATAYVDTRLNPMMKDVMFGTAESGIYPSLVYASAAGAYNKKDYEHATEYLAEYIRTGETSHRENVLTFLGQAAINTNQSERFVDTLLKGTEEYPVNFNLMLLTLQNMLNAGETTRMQPVLDKALLFHPDDEQLLNVQGRLLEGQGQYADALTYFEKLCEIKPNSLNYNQHLALCYYNLGADYYNKAIMESDDKQHKKYMRQATAYFTTAADRLGRIVDNDPSNIKYLTALAKTYGCLGRKEGLDELNNRLAALGQPTVKINDMPQAINVENVKKNNSDAVTEVIPDFQTFSVAFVTEKLSDWSKIREFEKREDFAKRVNEQTVLEEHKRLSKEAERMYLDKYASKIHVSDMKLMPYDAENECYKIESALGDFVINVPLKNHEAEVFKQQWETVQIREPRYYIKDNHVAIASITLVTTAGKSYSYSSTQAANYDYTPVSVDASAILAANVPQGNTVTVSSHPGSTASSIIYPDSDVDINIPVTSNKATKTLALVMANENYKSVSGVESALHDGQTFAKYCKMTLGIPETQVMYYSDITLGGMIDAVSKTKRLVSAMGDDVDVIVYYAGHGFPDEATKDAYLLPVDGNGVTTATAYSLKKFYSDLSSMGAANVMVFLDACFSGASRDGDMLVKARGVALKPKEAAPEGNMFVLSAASDQETAMPYRKKYHGLFTYYLLKKIQDSKGKVSLKDLSKYVEDNVKKNSVLVNGKPQTPRASVSGKLATEWGNKKLRN